MTYTYEQYAALYEALGGVTTHFMLPLRPKQKNPLSRQEFEERQARLEEIESHDEDWLFKNHPNNYIDVREGEMWERRGLRSDLFVIELEEYEKIQEAMKGVTK